uniref:Uncharacterized protein n=1 Tax=Arundo donax TaxID=35708 RepID=A0A0A8Z7A3_ARUDO
MTQFSTVVIRMQQKRKSLDSEYYEY